MAAMGAALHGFWLGLPKWGKIAIVAVAAVVVFNLISGGCGHSSSWQWGHDHAGSAKGFVEMGFSPESACRGEVEAAIAFKDKPPPSSSLGRRTGTTRWLGASPG